MLERANVWKNRETIRLRLERLFVLPALSPPQQTPRRTEEKAKLKQNRMHYVYLYIYNPNAFRFLFHICLCNEPNGVASKKQNVHAEPGRLELKLGEN